MLAIPMMKPEPVAFDVSNLEKTLRAQKSFSDEMIINDVKHFEVMRKEILVIHDPTDSSQTQLLSYFYQLKSMVPRLSPLEAEIKLPFFWNDAFVHGKRCQLNLIYYEMAAILWNLGAFESMRGAKVDRSTDEGVRLAGKHFQQAAGYFDYLKDNLLSYLQANTLQCLTADCLNMVKLLMLAQGQLCFYEKAVRDKKRDAMKTGIVAKLASQSSTFYQNTATASRTGSLGGILDISWFAITEFQAKCFKGASEYWQALASKELALTKGSGYGEEVARYNRAENYVRSAIEVGRKYTILPSLLQGAEALLNIIASNRQNALKDLSTVYMENVPNEGSLPEVLGVAMVKPSTLPDQSTVLSSFDALLFKFVLPKPILEANQRFYNELNSLINATVVASENATNIGRTTLSSVGLPGSLEGIKTENSIPATLWNKILKIQSMGSTERLKTMLMDLNNSSRRAMTSMKLLEETITTEENKDNAFFKQNPQYNGTKSSMLDIDIKTNLTLLKEAFNNAQVNDETITKEIIDSTTAEMKFLLLTKTRDELTALFPSSSSSSSSQKPRQPPPPPPKEVNLLDFDDFPSSSSAAPVPPPPSVKSPVANDNQSLLGPDGLKLEEKLHELAEIFEYRIQQVDKLKSYLSLNINEIIQSTLLSSPSSASAVPSSSSDSGRSQSGLSPAIQEIYDRNLNDIKNLKGAIDNGFQHQDELISSILALNDSFMKYKSNNPILQEKNRFLTLLDEQINKFFSLHSQLNAGSTFYSNLQAKLTTLQQNIDDLSYTQQWQRTEYEKDSLTQQNRYEQEQRDHELAIKLANELTISNNTTPSPAPIPVGAQPMMQGQPQGNQQQYPYGVPQPPPPPQTQPTMYSSQPQQYGGNNAPIPPTIHQPPSTTHAGVPGVVYGTPVSGPPSGYQQIAPPNPANQSNPSYSSYNSNQPTPATNYYQQTAQPTNPNQPISYANTSSGSSYPPSNQGQPVPSQGGVPPRYGSNVPQYPHQPPQYQQQPQPTNYSNYSTLPSPPNAYSSLSVSQQQPPPVAAQPQTPLTSAEMDLKVRLLCFLLLLFAYTLPVFHRFLE
jgi:programmed cell death 6-interacting protein